MRVYRAVLAVMLRVALLFALLLLILACGKGILKLLEVM